jgi:hypothetical protein
MASCDGGQKKNIYARIGDEVITLRAPKDVSIQPGEIILLDIYPEKILLFCKGKRI